MNHQFIFTWKQKKNFFRQEFEKPGTRFFRRLYAKREELADSKSKTLSKADFTPNPDRSGKIEHFNAGKCECNYKNSLAFWIRHERGWNN